MTETVRSGETEREEDAAPRATGVVHAPHLFVVLECANLETGGSRHNLGNLDEVHLLRGDERRIRRVVREGRRILEIQLVDRKMSSRHGTIRRATSGFVYEDLGSTNGSRVDGKSVSRQALLEEGSLIEAGQALLRFRGALPTPVGAPLDVAVEHLRGPFEQTLLPGLQAQLATLARVSRSPVAVLLLGETGSGKDVLARAVHSASGRRGELVTVNCGAIPDTLVESILFGHERGAFSGAIRDEVGLVRAADGGTLFLDEIGNLPKTSQAALLRVLQDGEVLAVGATRAVHVDLRVVAATNALLPELVAEGAFREDLLARLSGLVLTLSPLRERREDLGLLVGRLLASLSPAGAAKLRLNVDAGRALVEHSYPQNVRELAHKLQLALALSDDGVVLREHLGLEALAPGAPAGEVKDTMDPADAELKQRLIEELQRAGGSVSDVARAMGKARMQIQRWMKRFGIEPSSFRET